MTRVNTSIHPTELPDKLLIAEHREIKRIPSAIAKGRFNLKNVPPDFTLGKGHVSFFYDKLQYLKGRYEKLYEECVKRGFNVTWFGDNWDKAFDAHPELFGNWNETEESRRLIIERIQERGFQLLPKH